MVVFLTVFGNGTVPTQLMRHIHCDRPPHCATQSEQLDLTAEEVRLFHSLAVIFEVALYSTALLEPFFPVVANGLVRKRPQVVGAFLFLALGQVPSSTRRNRSCYPAEEATAIAGDGDAVEVYLHTAYINEAAKGMQVRSTACA